jgi:hypothetical protein
MSQRRTPHTALLVFSLSAWREAGRKGLLGLHRQADNARLFEALIQRTQTLAQASGIDVVWLDETRQRGHGFGERLTHAFEELYAEGYNHVIAIGNDSPTLSVALIHQAVGHLQAGTKVLGPAFDGGVYLIGLHRDDFEAAAFQALPWNTGRLYEAMRRQAARQQVAVLALRRLLDLDDRPSLGLFLTFFPDLALARLAQALLSAAFPSGNGLPVVSLAAVYRLQPPLRGPPR